MSSRVLPARRLRDLASAPAAASPACPTTQEKCEACSLVGLVPVVADAEFDDQRHLELGDRLHQVRYLSLHAFKLAGGDLENQLVVHLHDQYGLELLFLEKALDRDHRQ